LAGHRAENLDGVRQQERVVVDLKDVGAGVVSISGNSIQLLIQLALVVFEQIVLSETKYFVQITTDLCTSSMDLTFPESTST
jgi:hypothetical protein